MAPLSVLPGRLRFEASSLNGDEERCLLVVESVMSVPGVKEASASHRTGRVLITFDDKMVTREEVEAHLGKALQAATTSGEERRQFPLRRNSPSRETRPGVGHFMMEMALHAFLPAPLDLLLPTAATAFRK